MREHVTTRLALIGKGVVSHSPSNLGSVSMG